MVEFEVASSLPGVLSLNTVMCGEAVLLLQSLPQDLTQPSSTVGYCLSGTRNLLALLKDMNSLSIDYDLSTLFSTDRNRHEFENVMRRIRKELHSVLPLLRTSVQEMERGQFQVPSKHAKVFWHLEQLGCHRE